MLHGRRVLVTGSSAGIGLAAAAEMLRQGARVALNSHLPLTECPDVAALLDDFPETARYLQADLASDAGPAALVAAAWHYWGGLDVLVNNVGTFREPAFLDLSLADFDRLFRLNVWSALACSQAFVRHAAGQGKGGRILFTSSLNGSRSEPGHTLYDATKGAINALTRQLALELAPLGFTTAAVAPGFIETPLTDMGLRSDPPARAAMEAAIPAGRIGTAADVAAWLAFLASDASRYATGVVIPVDGGLDAQQMSGRVVGEAERQARSPGSATPGLEPQKTRGR